MDPAISSKKVPKKTPHGPRRKGIEFANGIKSGEDRRPEKLIGLVTLNPVRVTHPDPESNQFILYGSMASQFPTGAVLYQPDLGANGFPRKPVHRYFVSDPL